MIACLVASISYPAIDPVALRLGPIAIRWYGIAYLLGFGTAYLLLRRMVRQGEVRISPDQLQSLVSWLVLGVILGGRLGWWLVYQRSGNTPQPWYEPLALWHGGMSFHGGLVGTVMVLVVWSWRHKAPLFNLSDSLALVTPIGLFFGRIANFINAELVGRATDLPWGVFFPGESFARHPSQLYEAVLEGPFLLLVLVLLRRRLRSRQGCLAALFVALYGLLRFGVEFTRQPDAQIGFIAFGWLTMGQLLSLALLPAGAVQAWIANRKSLVSR